MLSVHSENGVRCVLLVGLLIVVVLLALTGLEESSLANLLLDLLLVHLNFSLRLASLGGCGSRLLKVLVEGDSSVFFILMLVVISFTTFLTFRPFLSIIFVGAPVALTTAILPFLLTLRS